MRPIKYLLIVFLTYLIQACREKKNSPLASSLVIEDSIHLPLRFKPSYKYINAAKIHDREYIWVAEPLTDKKIYFFDTQGKPVDTIHLDRIMNILGGYNENLTLEPGQTILYTPKQIIFLDNESKDVLKIFNVDSLFGKQNDVYMFSHKLLKNFNKPSTSFLLINLWWRKFKQRKVLDGEYYKIQHTKPIFVILDKKTGKIIKRYAVLTWFNPEPYNAFHTFDMKVCNDGNIAVFTRFSDTIYFLDTIHFNLSRKLPVKSNRVSTKAPMLPVDYDKPITYHLGVHGGIINLFYSPSKKLYYVIVADDLEDLKLKNREKQDFAIMVYDTLFRKKQEYIVNASEYEMFHTFVTDKGLWLMKNNKNYDKKGIYLHLVH